MNLRPDRKFFSEYALKLCHEKLRKNQEQIIISSDCFWAINNNLLYKINYEIYKPQTTALNTSFADLYAAVECNNTKYIDEIIYVGMPWELEEANKYFGDVMIINAYDY